MERIKVGRLNKTFGTKGHIKVIAEDHFVPDLRRSDVWFIEVGGNDVPYFVETTDISAHFLVKFEDVDSPEVARKLTGGTIRLRDSDVTVSEAVDEDPLSFLTGFTIIDVDGASVGMIESIEEYPQQMMAVVQVEGAQILIPLAAEFVIDIDHENLQISMDLPAGLIDAQISPS